MNFNYCNLPQNATPAVRIKNWKNYLYFIAFEEIETQKSNKLNQLQIDIKKSYTNYVNILMSEEAVLMQAERITSAILLADNTTNLTTVLTGEQILQRAKECREELLNNLLPLWNKMLKFIIIKLFIITNIY
jgi:hypothetical protein